jgi:hypothetical protein
MKNPTKLPCCAHLQRNKDSVLSQGDIGVRNRFVGGEGDSISRKSNGIEVVKLAGSICEGSSKSVPEKGYTLSDLLQTNVAKDSVVSVVAIFDNIRFQTLSSDSFWCEGCVDYCHAVHFSEDAPLHFTCSRCIETERQAGFFTPKRIVHEVGVYFLLEFFGFDLPDSYDDVPTSKRQRNDKGFFTMQEIVENGWHVPHLSGWLMRQHPPREWSQRKGECICVYDVSNGVWDVARVICNRSHQGREVVNLDFTDPGDDDSDVDDDVHWEAVIWKDEGEVGRGAGGDTGGRAAPPHAKKQKHDSSRRDAQVAPAVAGPSCRGSVQVAPESSLQLSPPHRSRRVAAMAQSGFSDDSDDTDEDEDVDEDDDLVIESQ